MYRGNSKLAEKVVKVHNKSDKPDNIIKKEYDINSKSRALEKELPPYLSGFHAYLRGNVLPDRKSTRLNSSHSRASRMPSSA